MTNALVGYTGFVGSNLLSQFTFDDCYNTKNISDITGKSYDLLVLAGLPAEKWKANADPVSDWDNIGKLIRILATVKCKKCILISTVDVFPEPKDVYETTFIDYGNAAVSAYGFHRKLYEEMILSQFDTTIIRLPGLVGKGLKKNVIFDMMNNNCVDKIDPEAVHQYYNLSHLWTDIQQIPSAVKLIHFVTTPIQVHVIAEMFFPDVQLTHKDIKHATYNVKSRIYAGRNLSSAQHIEEFLS